MLPVTRHQHRRWPAAFPLLGSFDQALNEMWSDTDREELTARYPVDVREDEAHLYIEAELPGFTREQVDVTLEGGVLRISAERKAEEKAGDTHVAERYTRIARSFNVPSTVDNQKVEAKLDNGVLYLTLHKREELKPRRIDIG